VHFSVVSSSSACMRPSHGTTATTIGRLTALTAHLNNNAIKRSTSTLIKMLSTGSCYCRAITYQVELNSADDARTSLCHCKNCKKFTGGPFGVTSKIPKSSFKIKSGSEHVKVHEADNGSGVILHREFCDTCGTGLLEYGANAGDFIYIFYGTLDNPEDLPPKGEFFCKKRDSWMPEIPGIFHKQEIKE